MPSKKTYMDMIDKQRRKYKAIILAAGYGTRLAPLTDEIPKPLIPVGDRTLLENILNALAEADIANFAINTHHLGKKIIDVIEKSRWKNRVKPYPEKKILGTGGPLINAGDMLKDCDGFVLHNSDILTDLDFRLLTDYHEESGALVTMVMIDGPENKVAVNKNGMVIDILGKLGREGDERKMTYGGIAVFSPAIFEYLPEKVENCSIITAILAAMQNDPKAVAAYISNIYWNDLGTVEKFLDAQHDITDEKIVLQDFAPSIPMLMAPLPYPGASERMFFRVANCASNISKNQESRIAMCASKDSADFERFLTISKFLNEQKLGVPEIYHSSSKNHVVIMEDLGNDILYNRLEAGITEVEKEKLYRKIIEWLVKFQSDTHDKIYSENKKEIPASGIDKHNCINDQNIKSENYAQNAQKNIPNQNALVHIRLFDLDYLRWETDYFAENFLINYCGISKKDVNELGCEFCKLAEETMSQPQLLIHRDFQSQNILLKDGKIRIVDFQGARIGNIAYDLMSLLKDPYVALSKDLRTSLIAYYYELYQQTPLAEIIKFSGEEFAKFAATAALQRNMQALGAYGFLGLQKGKKEYLEHIPQGLTYLKDGLYEFQKHNQACCLPKLTEMVMNLKK